MEHFEVYIYYQTLKLFKMGYVINLNGAIISMCNTDVVCPNCQTVKDCSSLTEAINKSKEGVIYKKCSTCKKVLGITADMQGDNVCWLKQNEK